MPPQGHMPPGYMPPNVGMDPQSALAYSNYVQQQQRGSQYMPPSGLQQHAGHQS